MTEAGLPDLQAILALTVEMHGSDLHLQAGSPPVVRVYGELVRLDMPRLMPRDVEDLLYPILDANHREQLETQRELDFSYSVPGLSRFRVNVMRQRGTLAAAFRVIPMGIPRVEDLGLPAVVREFARLPRGLVLVTGPTGSGKSTTLAALIEMINQERSVTVITIEDPIEFLHSHKKAIIKQREVGSDTHSFSEALRHVLRHDPDVIMIGEMRDLESISIALTAAETGHLVFSTLHTQTAALTIHRIIDVFTGGMRNLVVRQLADCLQGVISQQLVRRADNHGRVAAVEVLVSTPAVRNLIREGKEHQLYTTIQTGRAFGMQTMDQALADLYQNGVISRDTAFARCVDRVELERELRRIPSTAPPVSAFSPSF
ncbi:MAG TPA: type IV pilus twitching motility protein PilT [Firmicutes bacterium]|nr:type IV pilus twitching motility protein PilT [Bacillota bacterium]